MPITFENLTPGEQYDRVFLAQHWGYRSHAAIDRGIVISPQSNVIILFVTKEKQRSSTQYADYFDGDTLRMEGETKRVNDQRLIDAASSSTEIHLFYRERHHSPFIYFGPVFLQSYELNTSGPSRFAFETSRSEIMAGTDVRTELITHADDDGNFIPDAEGRKRLRLHHTYERSRKNRARAVQVHGTTCCVCGFNFDSFYGAELARSYIEIHHVSGLSGEEQIVDPEVDLQPLCSNCHSMAHRRGAGLIVSLDELRDLVRQRGSAL